MRQADVILYALNLPMESFFGGLEIEDVKNWQKPLYDNLITRMQSVPFYQKWGDKIFSTQQMNEMGHQNFVFSLSGPASVESKFLLDDSIDGDIISQEHTGGTTGRCTTYFFGGFSGFQQTALQNYLRTRYSPLPMRQAMYSYLFRVRQESAVGWSSTCQFFYDPAIYKYPYNQVHANRAEFFIPIERREEFLSPEFYLHNDFTDNRTFCSLTNLNMFIRSMKMPGWLLITPSQADFLISIENDRKLKWTAQEYCPLILSTCETLHEPMRNKIQEYFGKETFILDHCFHTDGGAHVWKCSEGTWHLWPFCIAEQSDAGELVTTSLVSQRVIWHRYNTENVIENLRWGKCKCGFTGQIFDNYIGRNVSILFVNGRCFMPYHVYATIHHMYAQNMGFAQSQVIQKENGDIEILVIPRKNRPHSLDEFGKLCRDFFQTDKCQVKIVDKLIAKGRKDLDSPTIADPSKDLYHKIQPIISYLPKSQLVGLLSDKEK